MKNAERTAKPCAIDQCKHQAIARGLCMNHYKQERRAKKKTGEWKSGQLSKNSGPCLKDGCGRPRRAKGLCTKHYEETRREHRGVCTIEGCHNQNKQYGLCSTHYKRLKKHGTTDKVAKIRPICKDKSCDLIARTNGYCQKHYASWRKYGSSNIAEKKKHGECLIEGCNDNARRQHLCDHHFIDFKLEHPGENQTYIDYVYTVNTANQSR